MTGRRPKTPPARIPCTTEGCRGKLEITYARTTYDGRKCEKCGTTVLTCHYCIGVMCDWAQGPPLSEQETMPHHCPHCGGLMYVRDYKGPPRYDVQHFMPGVQKWTNLVGAIDLTREAAEALFEQEASKPGHAALRLRCWENQTVVREEKADGEEEGA